MSKAFSRRNFLQMSAVGAASMLAACAPQVVKETVVVTEEKVVKETVVVTEKEAVEVEKEVTRVVEKVVEVNPLTAEELLPEQDKLGSPDHPRGWKTTLPDLPAGVPHTPMVEITITRRAPESLEFGPGDTVDNNSWSRMIESLFGVKFKVEWTWSLTDEAMQKYNLAMASGDLPDYMETVPETIFVKMVEAGMAQDITEAYQMYASPRWKETWRKYGDLPWVWSRLDGRIYGLPRVEDLAHNDNILWYREDWLEKVGLGVPETLDDLKAVALAFKENDLGQGDVGTTVGLQANIDWEHTWAGSIDPIWGAFGIIPDHWSEDGAGGLQLDITMKDKAVPAIELLNAWYNAGVFRDDFYTMDAWTSWQDVMGNRCGLQFTPSWGATQDSVTNDPDARWAFTNIPMGPDGSRMKHTENNFREGPFVFSPDCEHVDKIFEITNWWLQLYEDPWRRFHGWEDVNYEWTEDDKIASLGVSSQHMAVGPLGTRGSGFIDPEFIGRGIRYRQDEWKAIPEDKRDAYQEYYFNDPLGIAELSDNSRLYILETAHLGKMTKLQRTPTPTMVEAGVDLDKIIEEAVIGMIIGEKPISDYDEMVEQWKKIGGDFVTEEVNEWWKSQ